MVNAARVIRSKTIPAIVAGALAAGTLMMVSCQGKSPEPAATVAIPTIPPPASPPPTANDAAVDVAADVAVDAPAGGAEAGRVETDLYQMSFDGIRKCDTTTDSQAADRVWMGVAIRAQAKVREMFVTPQDFTLEKGGIVVSARHINPPRLPKCLPLLPALQLQTKQAARGFVLFEVPSRFRTNDTPVVLAYRPTRWGGARRVEFSIPSCLDVCGDTVVDVKKMKSARKRSPERRTER